MLPNALESAEASLIFQRLGQALSAQTPQRPDEGGPVGIYTHARTHTVHTAGCPDQKAAVLFDMFTSFSGAPHRKPFIMLSQQINHDSYSSLLEEIEHKGIKTNNLKTQLESVVAPTQVVG